MDMMSVREDTESVDILILHGLSSNLVSFLKDTLESLGLSAASPMQLPSLKLWQDAKVDQYITNCRVPIAIVSFDEEEPGSNKARPNVYDEIQRCRRLKKDDVILLQEFRGKLSVDLPSNLIGQMVVFPFDQTALHSLIPPLLRELRSRNLFAVKSLGATAFEAGDIMNSFLDEMNNTWDHDFDEAWESIHTSDYEAERNLTECLDKFFQDYLGVFTALVKDKVRGEDLKNRCTTALTHSKTLATEAWRIVAQSKLKNAQEEGRDTPASKAGATRALLEKADAALRRGLRERASLKERTKEFKAAIDWASRYVEAVRSN
jgi:hypothetical protein